MPRQSRKAQTTNNTPKEDTTMANFWSKVNPSDGKITLRVNEPEGQTGEFTELTKTKSTKIRSLCKNHTDSNGVAKYEYILRNLDGGQRSFQGIKANNQIHGVILAVIMGKAASEKFMENLPKAAAPKATTKSTGRKTSKRGRKASSRKAQTTAPASGGNDLAEKLAALLKEAGLVS